MQVSQETGYEIALWVQLKYIGPHHIINLWLVYKCTYMRVQCRIPKGTTTTNYTCVVKAADSFCLCTAGAALSLSPNKIHPDNKFSSLCSIV